MARAIERRVKALEAQEDIFGDEEYERLVAKLWDRPFVPGWLQAERTSLWVQPVGADGGVNDTND